ncbi:MAG: hypothetical protein WC436_04560 [Candidatus Babeliales bacterium]
MKKSLLLSILLTATLIATHAFSMENEYAAQTNNKQNGTPDILVDQIISNPDQKKQQTTLNSKIKMIIKSILQDYIDFKEQSMLFNTFQIFSIAAHEFGHYISAKLLDPNSNPIIHLFSNGSLNPPLFSIGDLNVHKETLDLSFNLIRPILNSTSNALVAVSGPIAGLTSMYFFLFIKTFIQKYRETKNFKNSIVFAIKHYHTPFKNLLVQKNLGFWQFLIRLGTIFKLLFSIIDQTFYGFSPIDVHGGDGWHLWQHFFNNDRAFKHELCTLAQNNTKLELPLIDDDIDDFFVIENLSKNSTKEFPLDDLYVNKYMNDANFMKQIKEFVDKKGSDWCLNSNDQRLGKGLILKTTYYFAAMAFYFLLYKTSNCFCTFMFNEKTIFHACWNKILRPVGRGIKAFPVKLKKLLSYILRGRVPCKQNA